MIRGITVTLYERTQTGTDDFNAPVYTETPVEVRDVLVTPTAAEDLVNEIQIYGKRSEYTLCLPKGDSHDWTDARVDFFGKSFRAFGPPQEWIGANVPGPWNKKIRVERYE